MPRLAPKKTEKVECFEGGANGGKSKVEYEVTKEFGPNDRGEKKVATGPGGPLPL